MWGDTNYYSVLEYEQEYEKGIREHQRDRETNSRPSLHWTECLPRIEHLSTHWYADRGLKIRIIDEELYHQQMREFLCLA